MMPKARVRATFGASALLLGALALTGCGGSTAQTGSQTPVAQKPNTSVTPSPAAQTPAIQTPAKAGLGLYQLSLTGANGGAKSASIQKVGFGTQGAEVTGLTFKSSNYGTYVDQATGTLHMWATFDVTNNSAQALAVPTFIPVATTGTTTTIGGTAFKNLKYFDGSDASATASSLSFDTPNDANAAVKTPLVNNLDSADIQVSLPAGTQLAGISRSGWQMSALSAGATGQVTLAASIPQASNPAQNPFSFDLLFTVADSVPTTTITNIGAVQGKTPAGDQAGLSGSQTVSGVVTSVTPGLSGFFVQEQTINADKDSNTSDGIFVYCGAGVACPALSVGDVVKVTGTASEYSGLTELTASASGIVKQNSGFTTPAPVALTLPLDTKTLERYEGMRVAFPETLTVTDNYPYGRYGELGLSNAGRQFIASNGNASSTPQSEVLLDDGISAQNPLNLSYLSSENTRRTGDTVTGLTGVWHTVAGTPMLEPEGAVNFVSANPRPAQPKEVGGTLRVAGANMLNYFTTFTNGQTFDGKTGQGCSVSGSVAASNCRGANNLAEYQRQRAKMTQTITTLNPDVLAVMETQNDNNVTINEIVQALNSKAGAGTYAGVQTGVVGSDAIRVGIIYKPAKVTPIGAPMIDTNSVYSRPPVAQTFQDKATGGVFTVVANHLKSKGSCPTSGDTDTGQGCWNQLRVQQAQALMKFVSNTVIPQSGDKDVLLLGDFNAYGAEDPIKTIQGSGFESLNLRIPADDRYSYQFGGQFGYLDHALSSANLSSQVTGITEWHVNSDEPTIADYNTEYKAIPECGSANTCTGKDLFDASNPFRSSDHDPVLVGLNLSADSVTLPAAKTSLSASPSSLTVGAGNNATVTLTTSTQNYNGADLSISSAAEGLNVTPSAATVAPNGSFNLTVGVPANTAAGTYPVTVTITGDNGLGASTTINVTVTAGGTTPPVNSVNHLVISQVYGGGGNKGASYTNDFIELFNPTSSDINLSGYSLEYFSSKGSSGGKTALSGTIKAGGYFLVQEASNAAVGAAMPAADVTGTLAMSATDGSVALSNSAGTIDLIGFGTATKFEGAATSALGATTAALRNASGCTDTDNNKADFAVTTVAPRNSSSPVVICQ